MFVIQTKNKIQLTCGSRSLFVWCVLQLLSWLRQGGRSMETNNGGVTAMHLGTASVGIFIILSPCIKLDVLARLIRSKSHSVDCNELIRLSKSCSVDTLRKEAGWDLVPSASAIKKNPPHRRKSMLRHDISHKGLGHPHFTIAARHSPDDVK